MLHSVAAQKTSTWIFIAMKTSNLVGITTTLEKSFLHLYFASSISGSCPYALEF
jgi:hypothetical protein